MNDKKALKLALEALTNAIAIRNGDGGTKFVDPLEPNTITAIKAALAQLPQPVQRKPLTDEEIQGIWDVAAGAIPGWLRHIAYARAIEAAHGIKENT